MMKKFLLFAILAPVAMQQNVEAYITMPPLTFKQVCKNIAFPWIDEANAPIERCDARGLGYIDFNLKLDLVTFGLGFLSFFYGVGLEQRYKDSTATGKVLTHNLLNNWLPTGLIFHEIYKRSTTLVLGKRQDAASYLVSLTKLGLCLFKNEFMSKARRNHILQAANFPV